MPNRVYLLRGNHETKLCTTMYGFEQEVKTKFGEEGEMVYQKCLECFKELPLASIISNSVYTTHGGLFRSTRVGPVRRSKRKRAQNLELGSLEELSKVERFLIDPPDGGPSILADILWSDPSKEDGLVENADKQRGLSWGPDCTETFLKEYKLKVKFNIICSLIFCSCSFALFLRHYCITFLPLYGGFCLCYSSFDCIII